MNLYPLYAYTILINEMRNSTEISKGISKYKITTIFILLSQTSDLDNCIY